MSNLLHRLLGRALSRTPTTARDGVFGVMRARPLPTIYAIGDVHGRLDLYRELEARIASDEVTGEKLVVLLGDMIDRGPDSAGMIDHLLAPPPAGLARLSLAGNHEDMALRFLRAPDPKAEWLAHGGVETLASYGIVRDFAEAQSLPRKVLAMRVAAHVPQEHLDFLAAMPLFLHAGPFFLCHAGIDPALPLERQNRQTLLWSRRFATPEGPPPRGLAPGGSVIQGHMPIARAEQRDWRINLDTGAYITGQLSAVRLAEGYSPEFFSTGEAGVSAANRPLSNLEMQGGACWVCKYWPGAFSSERSDFKTQAREY
ncbi:metallophosphoesterase [Phaeovulum sp.]|uniref:metallophosphoesterase n=1 Tax=Phaeovulum sp. TaxID=2934796 RepID=UPI003563B979